MVMLHELASSSMNAGLGKCWRGTSHSDPQWPHPIKTWVSQWGYVPTLPSSCHSYISHWQILEMQVG